MTARSLPRIVELLPDSSFDAASRLFEDLAQVPLELRERLLSLLNATPDPFRIEVNGRTAAGTFLVGLRLMPQFADSLREFAAAARARDFDFFFVEHSKSSAVECVATPTVMERGMGVEPVPLSLRLSAMPEVIELPALLAELAALPEQVLEPALEIVQRLLGGLDAFPQLLRVEPDRGAAAGTVELVIVLAGEIAEPLRDLLAALRAGNFNPFVFEHRWFSDREIMGGLG